MKKYLLLLIGSFIMTATANAMHEVRPAYLQIIQIDETSYEIYWKVPSMGTAIPKINPVFGNNFTVEQKALPNFTGASAIFSYVLISEVPLAGSTIYIDGLNKTLIDALVTVTSSHLIVYYADGKLLGGYCPHLCLQRIQIKTLPTLGTWEGSSFSREEGRGGKFT